MKTQVQISIPTASGSTVSDNAFLDRDTGEVFLSAAFEKQLQDLGVDLKSVTANVLVDGATLVASVYKPQVAPGALWVDVSTLGREEAPTARHFGWKYKPLSKSQKSLLVGWLQSISVAATGGAVVFVHNASSWDQSELVDLFSLVFAAVVTFFIAAGIGKGE